MEDTSKLILNNDLKVSSNQDSHKTRIKIPKHNIDSNQKCLEDYQGYLEQPVQVVDEELNEIFIKTFFYLSIESTLILSYSW